MIDMANHRIIHDPRTSYAADGARRAAEALEDELATQEAIAELDARPGAKPPGITSREEIAGRDDLQIAHGQGFGGCSFAMLAPPAPTPAPAVNVDAEIDAEIEIEIAAQQTVGPAETGRKP